MRRRRGDLERAAGLTSLAPSKQPAVTFRKGTNEVSTDGVTANFMCLGKDLLDTPVKVLLSSPKCQGVPFFCNLSKSILLQRPH